VSSTHNARDHKRHKTIRRNLLILLFGKVGHSPPLKRSTQIKARFVNLRSLGSSAIKGGSTLNQWSRFTTFCENTLNLRSF